MSTAPKNLAELAIALGPVVVILRGRGLLNAATLVELAQTELEAVAKMRKRIDHQRRQLRNLQRAHDMLWKVNALHLDKLAERAK